MSNSTKCIYPDGCRRKATYTDSKGTNLCYSHVMEIVEQFNNDIRQKEKDKWIEIQPEGKD